MCAAHGCAPSVRAPVRKVSAGCAPTVRRAHLSAQLVQSLNFSSVMMAMVAMAAKAEVGGWKRLG